MNQFKEIKTCDAGSHLGKLFAKVTKVAVVLTVIGWLLYWATCPGVLQFTATPRCWWGHPDSDRSGISLARAMFGPVLLHTTFLEKMPDPGSGCQTFSIWRDRESHYRLLLLTLAFAVWSVWLWDRRRRISDLQRPTQALSMATAEASDNLRQPDIMDGGTHRHRRHIGKRLESLASVCAFVMLMFWALSPGFLMMRCWWGQYRDDGSQIALAKSLFGPVLMQKRWLNASFDLSNGSVIDDEAFLTWCDWETHQRMIVIMAILLIYIGTERFIITPQLTRLLIRRGVNITADNKQSKSNRCVNNVIVLASFLSAASLINRFMLPHIEDKVAYIRRHSLTVVKFRGQAALIVNYVAKTKQIPESLEKVIVYYKERGRYVLAGHPEMTDAWGNAIEWRLDEKNEIIIGVSSGKSNSNGSYGADEKIVIVRNMRPNRKIADESLLKSQNVNAYWKQVAKRVEVEK